MSVSHSSQLIEQVFIHSPVSPEFRITVTQSREGRLVVFAIGTDAKIYEIRPDSNSDTGWVQLELGCPITPTVITAAQDISGRIVVAVADESTLRVALCSESDGGWSSWHELQPGNDVVGPARFYDIALRVRADGTLELFLVYLQRFEDPRWQYTYRIGRADVEADSWGIGFDVPGSFTGWWPVHVPAMGIGEMDGKPTLFLYVRETQEFRTWIDLDGETEQGVLLTLPDSSDYVNRLLAVREVGTSELFAVGLLKPYGDEGVFRYDAKAKSFVSLGSYPIKDADVVTDGAGVVSLLGVGTDGRLYHTTRSANADSWTEMEPIATDAAAVVGTDTSQEGPVFIVRTLNHQLRRFYRAPLTADWEMSPVELEATGSEWVMWYESEFTATNVTGQARPICPLRIRAEETTEVVVNGLTEVIGPQRILETTTNAAGVLTVYQRTEELRNLWVPELLVWADGQSEGEWLRIKAAEATRDRLYTVTAQELLDANGRQGQPLLPADKRDRAQELAENLSKAMSLGRPPRDSAAQHHPLPADAPPAGKARFTAAGADDSLSFEIDMNDAWEGIKEGVETVLSLEIRLQIQEGIVTSYEVAMETGRGLYQTVVRTLGQAFDVVMALFEEVSVLIETALEWLAYLFNWPAILAVRDEIAEMITDGIAEIPSLIELARLKTDPTGLLEEVRHGAEEAFSFIGQQIGSDSLEQDARSIEFTTLTNLLGNWTHGGVIGATWLLDRILPHLTRGQAPLGPMNEPVWQRVEETVERAANVPRQAQQAIDGLASLTEGIVGGGALMSTTINQLIQQFEVLVGGVIDFGEGLTASGVSAVEALVDEGAIQTVLSSKIQVSIINDIVQMIDPDSESSVSVLDLIALLAAIPVYLISEARQSARNGEGSIAEPLAESCAAWVVGGVIAILIGLSAAIVHALKEAAIWLAALLPVLWWAFLITAATLVDRSDPDAGLIALGLFWYVVYQTCDLYSIVHQKGQLVMAGYGVITATLLTVLFAVYEVRKKDTPKPVPAWQIVGNHVGTLPDFLRALDFIWRPPNPKPVPARVVVAAGDMVGMGAVATAAFIDYDKCKNEEADR